MRHIFTCIAFTALLAVNSCTTLREAGQVAAALSRPATKEQVDSMLKTSDANMKELDTQLKQMQASGHQPTDAELHDMVSRAISGKRWDNRAQADAAQALTQLPADQEISVNLVFKGTTSSSSGKTLNFNVIAFWGDYKTSSKAIHMSPNGKGAAKLDCGEMVLSVTPRVTGEKRGAYTVELTDKAGALLGRFPISQTGGQVELGSHSGKYDSNLAYFLPEDRLTAYQFNKAGSRSPYYGVVFIGKGYTYVESAKHADMSKGYLFPEVNLVLLPSAWMKYNDIADTRSSLKLGHVVAQGVIYSTDAHQD